MPFQGIFPFIASTQVLFKNLGSLYNKHITMPISNLTYIRQAFLLQLPLPAIPVF